MTDNVPTPASRRDIATVRAALQATADEGTDNVSLENDSFLNRLLSVGTWPQGLGTIIDELVEPPPADAPKLSPERRRALINAIGPELAANHRTSGSIEQVLHRSRTANRQSQAETAALLTPVLKRLTDNCREVTAEDIRHIETTLVTVDNDFARNVAAAWAAVLDLDPGVVSRAFAKSLQMALDPPLGMVAGREAHSADSAEERRIDEFEALYQRARDLREVNLDTAK